MVILAVVYMFNFVDRQILAILLPAIQAEFQVGDTVLGLLAGTAFALFYVTLGIPIAQIECVACALSASIMAQPPASRPMNKAM